MVLCACGIEERQHWNCAVCYRPFHKYKFLPDVFPQLGITGHTSPSLQICSFCHQSRKRYEDMRDQLRGFEPYPYQPIFPVYPYASLSAKDRWKIHLFGDGVNCEYGDPVGQMDETCLGCQQVFEPYITPKPIFGYLTLDPATYRTRITDDVLNAFKYCRDCREEYVLANQRSQRSREFYYTPEELHAHDGIPLPNPILSQPDPDAWLRRIPRILTLDDDRRGRRCLIVPSYEKAEDAKDTMALMQDLRSLPPDQSPVQFLPRREAPQPMQDYYHGIKCAHGVNQLYCYFCAAQGLNPDDLMQEPSDEPIDPRLYKLFIEHTLSSEKKMKRQDRILDFLAHNDIKISKEFLQKVSDHFHRGVSVLNRWKKLPDIFAAIFQRYNLSKFDHTLIRYFVKFLRPGQYHTAQSVYNAITYFVDARYKVKETLARRAKELSSQGSLNRWSEDRYRARLQRISQQSAVYSKYFNSDKLNIGFGKSTRQAKRVFVDSQIPRPDFGNVSLTYDKTKKQLIVGTIAKANSGSLEEVPYITQAVLLYALADWLGEDLHIKSIWQHDIINPVTLSIYNPKDLHDWYHSDLSQYDAKVSLHDQRSLMRPEYARKIALGTPNFRNSLDLARYLQDLSRGPEASLPPYLIEYSYEPETLERVAAMQGTIIFDDVIIVRTRSTRDPASVPIGYPYISQSSSSSSSSSSPPASRKPRKR